MIIIDARRWFQKSAGNTYHSVTVTVDGKVLGNSGIHYGYGQQYLQTAFAMLQEAEIFPKTDERYKSGVSKDWIAFTDDMKDHPEKYYITVADVSRKKDL